MFNTANDTVSADKQLPLHIKALGPVNNQATPYCLPQSPDVLSVCYRTQEHKFGCWIPPGKPYAYWIHPQQVMPVIPKGWETQYKKLPFSATFHI